MLSTPMTTLNNRLQLALLNRKKGQNALEKGFTLVELMIVIVIVGVLSAVALPNFLSQTNKARASEAQSQISAAFKNATSLYLEGPAATNTDISSEATTAITSAITATAVGTGVHASCGSDLKLTATTAVPGYKCSYLNSVLSIAAQVQGGGTVFGEANLSTGAITKPTYIE